MPKSQYEALFARQLEEAGLSFEREFRSHPERAWRFDFANHDLMLALEVEGGLYSRGRHTRGSGFIGDCEKYAEANLLGWWVYRIPAPWVKNGRALALAKRAVAVLSEA